MRANSSQSIFSEEEMKDLNSEIELKPRRREKKWLRKFSGRNMATKNKNELPDRWRKVPVNSRNSTTASRSNNTVKTDILATVWLETSESCVLATPEQVMFEKRILGLVSKCQQFCPKIYNKLNRLSSKSSICCEASRTKFGTNAVHTEESKPGSKWIC